MKQVSQYFLNKLTHDVVHICASLKNWNTRIAERYMGRSNAKAYGKRNSTEGVVLVRVKPTKIIAEKDVAAWE